MRRLPVQIRISSAVATSALCFLVACATPQAPRIVEPDEAAPAAEVSVFYPAGSCATGAIDVEVWDRDAKEWVPHPSHPRVTAGTCQTERSDQLLNEFRVRCVDPDGERAPSDWVEGAATPATVGEAAPRCPDPVETDEAPAASAAGTEEAPAA